MWQEVRPCEHRAERDGHVLRAHGGQPNWYCYRDGEYLGTEINLDASKKRCIQNMRRPEVVEFETTEEAYKKIKKPPKLKWEQQDKSNWQTTVEGEALPARIRLLDQKTYACYRDGKYLGSEGTLDLAQKRVVVNAISQKNKAMRLWEQEHPDELPPAMMLTDGERAEYWRRHPPKAAQRPVVGGRGATAAPKVGEDPATRALRESLAAEAGNRKAGKAGRARTREDTSDVPQGVIKVLGANPKKAGSAAHGRWALLIDHDGKQVSDFLAAKGNPTTLTNAIAKGVVRVDKEE